MPRAKKDYPEVAERRVVYAADSKEYRLIAPYDTALIAAIKTIPGAKWDKAARYWAVPQRPDSLARMVEVCQKWQVGCDAATAAALAAVVPDATLTSLPPTPSAASAAPDPLAHWRAAVDVSFFDTAVEVYNLWPTSESTVETSMWPQSVALPLASLRALEKWLKTHDTVRRLWQEVLDAMDCTRPVQLQQILLQRLAVETLKRLGIRACGSHADPLQVAVNAPSSYSGREGGYSDFRFSVAVSLANMGYKNPTQQRLDQELAAHGIALIFQMMLVYAYELGLRAEPWYLD